MNESNREPIPDVLEQATAALRDTTVPPGPSEDLTAATVAALNAQSLTIRPALTPAQLRRRRMIRYIGISSATAAVAGLLAIAGIVWSPTPAPAAEVADALENVATAKSYRHVITMTFDGQTMFEMKTYKQDDRMRFEAGPDMAIVVDGKGNAVQFDYANKTVSRLDIDRLRKDRPKPSDEMKSLAAKLRDRKGEGVERIGEEKLDGRTTTVYVLKDVALAGSTGDWKVWVDPKLDLPVRMEMTRGNAGVEAVVTSTFSGWNEPLDADLFRLDVPAGYTLVEGKK